MIQFEPVTEDEQKAIDELKERTSDCDLNPRMQKDETFYYRFLKARDFNVKNAEAMIRKHISDYKKYNNAEGISVETYEPNEIFRKYYPVSFLGFDKTGSVVRYVDMGGLDVKAMVTITTFKQLLQHVYVMLERDVDLMTEQTKLGKPANKVVFIINYDKLNLFRVTFKKALEWAYEGFKLYQDNYPERVKAIYMINAQFYFHIGYSVLKSALSDGLLKKIKCFGTTGWKEELLDIMDADVLPAFLGGTRTDPDGNPLCHTFITHATMIPEEVVYAKVQKKSLCKEEGVKKLRITRFSSSEIMFFICELGTKLEWEFETKTRDIAFALYFKEASEENAKLETLIPKQRVDTMLAAETGIYKCDKVGQYIITFDNSYSWIHSKEIYYRIRVIKPEETKDFVII